MEKIWDAITAINEYLLLEGNQNKNNCLTYFYNKVKFPALFSVRNRCKVIHITFRGKRRSEKTYQSYWNFCLYYLGCLSRYFINFWYLLNVDFWINYQYETPKDTTKFQLDTVSFSNLNLQCGPKKSKLLNLAVFTAEDGFDSKYSYAKWIISMSQKHFWRKAIWEADEHW